MPSNFDEAFAAVQSLAKDFDAQKDFYLSPKYQEAEVRKEFIDKFEFFIYPDCSFQVFDRILLQFGCYAFVCMGSEKFIVDRLFFILEFVCNC